MAYLQGWSSSGAAAAQTQSNSLNPNEPPTLLPLPTPPQTPQTTITAQQRPVEVVRASVFTSTKKSTDPNSFRVQMYKDMANSNYDVHMMETVGKGEKCVDIQLAVEMLHYATVPNSYDIAILLR